MQREGGMIIPESEPVKIAYRPLTDIERDDVARQALEQAASRIERQFGNPTYQRAWEIAAQIVRAMKP